MKNDKCLRRLNQYSKIWKMLLHNVKLVFAHFKQAYTVYKNWVSIQLVSDKSRPVFDWQDLFWNDDVTNNTKIFFMFEIPSKIFRYVLTSEWFNAKEFCFRFFLFCLFKKSPEIHINVIHIDCISRRIFELFLFRIFRSPNVSWHIVMFA